MAEPILRRQSILTTIIGILGTFGVLISSALVSVIAAGLMQWSSGTAHVMDQGFPLLVLFLGMLLCGRVAADLAPGRGLIAATGTALLVAAVGMMVSISSEAHGDAIEPPQVGLAALVVWVVIGGTAFLIDRRRDRRTS